MKRYCLVRDDDSHWYLIPQKLKSSFEVLEAEANAVDDYEFFNKTFEKYRSNGPHCITFTDPKEE